MSYKAKAQELYDMIGQGQMMDAFEKYYADNCTQIEATGETREGKDKCREALHQWAGMIQEMHGGGHGSITSDEANQTTMVESWVDVTFKDGNRIKMEEVAVQNWEGDQIVKERFYYNMPGQQN